METVKKFSQQKNVWSRMVTCDKGSDGIRTRASQILINRDHIISQSKMIIFITSILKSLVVPVIWLALIGAIYSRIAPFFALNRIFFPANEEVTLKTKQPIRFQGLFKVTNQIAGKWKTKSIISQILQLLFP